MDIPLGTVIGGKYRIERALARGGMGSVWVGRHVQLGSTVAVKFLDPSFAASAAHRARFEREARSAANLKSPHVVHVQDYGFEGAAPYLVMELLEGEDLGQRLERVGRLTLQDTARILAQVGKALKKAHEAGIVHRDLKPANLFLARVDDEEVVKVLDFGIAKESGGVLGDATRTGEVIGSPHYMSPEQVRAEKDLDHRTDLWSMGIILYRAVVGVLPFPGDQLGPVLAKILTDPLPVPSQIAPDLPPSIDAYLARALARDRTQRFQSMAEMVEAFQAAASGRFAGSMPPGMGPMAAPAQTAALGPAHAAHPMHPAHPHAGGAGLGGSGPQAVVGQSGPIGIGGSGPHGAIGQSGPHGAIGQSGPMHSPSGTTAGLASTGATATKSKGAGVAVALGVLGFLGVAAAVVLFVVRPFAAGATDAGSGAGTVGITAPATPEVASGGATVTVAPGASSGDAAPSTSGATAPATTASTASSGAAAPPSSASTTAPSTTPSTSTTAPSTKPAGGSTGTKPVTKPAASSTKTKEKWF